MLKGERYLACINILLLLIVELAGCYQGQGSSPLNILVVSSTQKDTTLPWAQGGDIFNMASLAVQDINMNATVLQQYELVLIPILVLECDPLESIDKYFSSLVNSSTEVVAVVGMFCDAVAESFSPIIRHLPNSNVLHISGSSLRYKDILPHHQVFHMVPSHEAIADGIVRVLLSFNWTRIGIVRAQTGHGKYATSNYWEAAEALTTVIGTRYYYNFTIPFKSELQGASSSEIDTFLRKLNSSQVNIVVAFVPLYTATSILKLAVEKGLVWPRLSWIFVHVDPIVSFWPKLWNNVIAISFSLPECKRNNYQERRSDIMGNTLFGNLIYDSIWRMALALNNSTSFTSERLPSLNNSSHTRSESTIDFSTFIDGVNTKFTKRSNGVNLVVRFVRNHLAEVIGAYNFDKQLLLMNNTPLEPVPPDRFQTILFQVPVFSTIILSLWLALLYMVLIFNTTLFVFFRKEPEVKATSVFLSSWIFLGSILMVVSSTIRVTETGVQHSISPFYDKYISCYVVFVLGGTGFQLIVATTLMKTLRIWNIFRHFGMLGKNWSDLRLVAIIIVIVLAQKFILVYWVSVDTYHLVERRFFEAEAKPPHYVAVRKCTCNYLAIWIIAEISYTLVLLHFLIYLAIKTRNIKRKDFKDTKKLMFLVISMQITLIVIAILLIFLEVFQPDVVYSVAEVFLSVGVFAIQVVLFSPKVLPPLIRYIKCKLQKFR